MITHELKCNNPYFSDVWIGKKKFETRFNDRNFQIGDFIILNEITDLPRKRKITAEIIYIFNAFGLKDNWIVIGIKVIDKAGVK